jgi:hypothetical protein
VSELVTRPYLGIKKGGVEIYFFFHSTNKCGKGILLQLPTVKKKRNIMGLAQIPIPHSEVGETENTIAVPVPHIISIGKGGDSSSMRPGDAVPRAGDGEALDVDG